MSTRSYSYLPKSLDLSLPCSNMSVDHASGGTKTQHDSEIKRRPGRATHYFEFGIELNNYLPPCVFYRTGSFSTLTLPTCHGSFIFLFFYFARFQCSLWNRRFCGAKCMRSSIRPLLKATPVLQSKTYKPKLYN